MKKQNKEKKNIIKYLKQVFVGFFILASLVGVIFAGWDIFKESNEYRYESELKRTYRAKFEVIDARDGISTEEVADSILNRTEYSKIDSPVVDVIGHDLISVEFGLNGDTSGEIIPEYKIETWANLFEITSKPTLTFRDSDGTELFNLTDNYILENSAKASFSSGLPTIKMKFKDDRAKISYNEEMDRIFNEANAPDEEGNPGPGVYSYNIWLDYDVYENILNKVSGNDDYQRLLDEQYTGTSLFDYSFQKDINGNPTSLMKDIAKPFLIGQGQIIGVSDIYSKEIELNINQMSSSKVKMSNVQAKYFANRINFGTESYELNFIGGEYQNNTENQENFTWIIYSFAIMFLIMLMYLIAAHGAMGALASLGLSLTATTFLLLAKVSLTPIGPIMLVSVFILMLFSTSLWSELIKTYKTKIKKEYKPIDKMRESLKEVLTFSRYFVVSTLVIGMTLLLLGSFYVQILSLIIISWSFMHLFMFHVVFKILFIEILKTFNVSNNVEKRWSWTIGFIPKENNNKKGLLPSGMEKMGFDKVAKVSSIIITIFIVIGVIVLGSLKIILGHGIRYEEYSNYNNNYEVVMMIDNKIYGEEIYDPNDEWGYETTEEIKDYEEEILNLESVPSDAKSYYRTGNDFSIVVDTNGQDDTTEHETKVITTYYTSLIIQTKEEIDVTAFEEELSNVSIITTEIDSIELNSVESNSSYTTEYMSKEALIIASVFIAFLFLFFILLEKWSGSLSLIISLIIDLALLIFAFGIFFIPMNTSFWVLMPIFATIFIYQKLILNTKFKKIKDKSKERFIPKQEIENEIKVMWASHIKTSFMFNLTIFLFGTVLLLLSFVTISFGTLGFALIWVGIINYVTTNTIFLKLREQLEIKKQSLSEKVWEKDLRKSKEIVSEQYIKDLNC